MVGLLGSVMLFVAWGATAQAADSFPAFSAPVVDQAGVVAADVKAQVNASLLAYQNRSGNQVAVAVIRTTGSRSIDDYSLDLARTWGVGQAGKDNGVLLVIAVEDHKLRIEVGNGLTGVLTDAQSASIINDRLVPLLRQGDFEGAVAQGAESIRAALGDQSSAVPTVKPAAPPFSLRTFWVEVLIGLFVSGALFTVVAVAVILGATRGGGRGRGGRGTPRNWWGGSGFGGGGYSGGGGGGSSGSGGGGGGDFSGGGASGGW